MNYKDKASYGSLPPYNTWCGKPEFELAVYGCNGVVCYKIRLVKFIGEVLRWHVWLDLFDIWLEKWHVYLEMWQ